MEYNWNVRWNSIPQIAIPVSWPSVAASVMTMIYYVYFWVFGFKWFVTNEAFSCFLI